jgi:hypothetical protein
LSIAMRALERNAVSWRTLATLSLQFCPEGSIDGSSVRVERDLEDQ